MAEAVLSKGKQEEWIHHEITPTELLKKETLRQGIAAQTDKYLAAGNKIEKIDIGRISKLPPVSKYDLYEHVLG